MMLPPCCGVGDKCSWFDDGDEFPLEPDPQLLQRIASVGGYFFTMQVRHTCIDLSLPTLKVGAG
mgnify:CR=1 FL=1